MPPSKRALELHAAYPPIDLHADTLMWSRWFDYDVHKRHEAPLPFAALGGHIDLPRIIDGGMGAQFFSLVSLPVGPRSRGPARAVTEQIDALDQAIERNRGALRLVHDAGEIAACNRDGAIGALLGIEGAHALEGDISRLDAFAQRGVRYLGLLHFTSNDAGAPAYGRGRDEARGLTSWGHELVAHAEELGVIVDLAHLNRRGSLDACAVARRPVIVSHTGVLGAYEHWRNIGDDQLRAVAGTGGCIGVIFCPRYLGGRGIDAVVRHLMHIVDIVGEDTPALGSDWDGFILPTPDLKDPRGLPLLTEALLEAGMSERVIAKILRGNALRVLDRS